MEAIRLILRTVGLALFLFPLMSLWYIAHVLFT